MVLQKMEAQLHKATQLSPRVPEIQTSSTQRVDDKSGIAEADCLQ